MQWFRVTYVSAGAVFAEFVVQAKDEQHAFDVSYLEDLRAIYDQADLPDDLNYSVQRTSAPATGKSTPWSQYLEPLPAPLSNLEWLTNLTLVGGILFLGLLIIGLFVGSRLFVGG